MRVVSSLLEYYRVASHVDVHQHARRNISEAQCLDSHKSPQAPGKNQLRVKNLKIKVMASQSIIAGYFSDEEYTSLDSDNKELLRMLASIVKNSKKED